VSDVRRIALVLLGLLATALVVHAFRGHDERPGVPWPTQPQPVTGPGEWPEYGYDPGRTHAAPFDLRPPFRVLWRQVADWSLVEFPPVVAQGSLYFGTNHGLVLGVDTATGAVRWRRELGRCIASSPAVAGDLLVVGVMAPTLHCGDDVPSYVVALDVRDGRIRWLHRTGGPVESSPLVAGSDVVVGSWNGEAEALDLSTGRRRWSFHADGPVKAGAARVGSTLFIGSYGGTMYALDTASGRLRWRSAAGAPFYATPAVSDGIVVAATTDGVVHAFAADSGAELWSRHVGRFAYAAAAIANGVAYVGSYDHRLYALSLRTGKVRWTHEGSGPVSGAPTVLGNLVFFSTCGSCSRYESNPKARRTFALATDSGALVWSFPDGEYSPVVTDGVDVFLTGYTSVYALVPSG
jgi:outer membrane protein assembly factor BamB